MDKIGYKELVAASEARIRTISAEEALEKLGSDDAVLVDLRDVRELWREGGIPGAFHGTRGGHRPADGAERLPHRRRLRSLEGLWRRGRREKEEIVARLTGR